LIILSKCPQNYQYEKKIHLHYISGACSLSYAQQIKDTLVKESKIDELPSPEAGIKKEQLLTLLSLLISSTLSR
jgi:hypothetical protein